MVNWVKRQPVSLNPLSLHRSKVGYVGEGIAANFLRKKGYRILERNFKARYGEIDIIAIDKDTLVFVEVKTRTGTQFGTPEEAITPWKLREVAKTAEFYASLHPELPQGLRIDVVGIVLGPNDEVLSLQHTPNVML